MHQVLASILVSLLSVCVAAAGDLATSENLFFIKRNKNANEVHYDARVVDCRWATPEVDSYWRDLADDPYEYEEIKWFERKAYGLDVERNSDTVVTIRLEALPERPVTATLTAIGDSGCSVSARTRIDGEDAELSAVYVFAKPNFFGLPRVHYIEILGHTDNGEQIWERLPQTGKGRKMKLDRPSNALWQSGAPTLGRRPPAAPDRSP